MSTTSARLSIFADHLDTYRQQTAELLPLHAGDDRDDVHRALVEAERALRNAERQLRRAARLAE